MNGNTVDCKDTSAFNHRNIIENILNIYKHAK